MRMKNRCAVVCALAVMGTTMMTGNVAMAQSETDVIAVPYLRKDGFDEVAMTNDDMVKTGINIRSAASDDSAVIGYMYRGGAAWVIEKGDEWTELYSGGLTGFVKNEYLVYGNEVRGLAEHYGLDGVATTWDDVKVFAAQDNSTEIASLDSGDAFILVEDFGHWLQIQYGADRLAYVSEEDVTHVLLLETAVGKDEVYTGLNATWTGSDYSEPSYDYSDDYSEPSYDYNEPSYDYSDDYNEPSYDYNEPSYDYNEPSYETPETSAPETEAPTPETSAPETEAPETSAPETEAPSDDYYDDGYYEDDSDDVVVDSGSDGYYDADTDTYYDGNGNVIDPDYGSQDSYTEDSYVEDTYVEDSYVEDSYVEETESVSASSSDADLLAAIIYCEAGNQSYEGMVAVGAVVMNRVYSSSFPNTISEVIYQSGQFTPAYSGTLASALANGVPSACYDAAYAALNGENPVGSALYFNTGSGKGIKIGAHQFY